MMLERERVSSAARRIRRIAGERGVAGFKCSRYICVCIYIYIYIYMYIAMCSFIACLINSAPWHSDPGIVPRVAGPFRARARAREREFN